MLDSTGLALPAVIAAASAIEAGAVKTRFAHFQVASLSHPISITGTHT